MLAESVLSCDQGRDSSLSLVEVLAKVTLVPSVPFKLISDEYPKRIFVPVCLILLALMMKYSAPELLSLRKKVFDAFGELLRECVVWVVVKR